MPTNDLRAQLCRVLGIEEMVACKSCDGRGSWPTVSVYCVKCNGTGRIHIPDAEIVEAVEALQGYEQAWDALADENMKTQVALRMRCVDDANRFGCTDREFEVHEVAEALVKHHDDNHPYCSFRQNPFKSRGHQTEEDERGE